MSVGPPLVPRRTALALGAAAIALTGCDDGDSERPGSVPSSTPSADPDTRLVDDILVELARAEQRAHAAGFQDLVLLHRAHIQALGGPATELQPGHVRKAPVRRTEVRLQRILVHASTRAESGALARLFASMSAAVSQRLTGRLV